MNASRKTTLLAVAVWWHFRPVHRTEIVDDVSGMGALWSWWLLLLIESSRRGRRRQARQSRPWWSCMRCCGRGQTGCRRQCIWSAVAAQVRGALCEGGWGSGRRRRRGGWGGSGCTCSMWMDGAAAAAAAVCTGRKRCATLRNEIRAVGSAIGRRRRRRRRRRSLLLHCR